MKRARSLRVSSVFPAYMQRCTVSKCSILILVGQSSLVMKIAASMLAGAGGALCGNPADVIMVRMQADGTPPISFPASTAHY